jgi:hypothetical protein
MQELDIQILCANTPQAKGRIERANQTLQDRLVKELRLQGISDMETANAFLPEFREDYNRRFAVVPRSSHNAHRPLLKADHLELILTHQETRTLSKNLTIQFKHVIYQIQSKRPGYALRNAKVTVCENAKGEVTILYKNKPLSYTIYHKSPRQAEVVDTKSLDRQIKTPKPPAANHPWRRYGYHLNGKPIEQVTPMAQIDLSWPESLSLLAENRAQSKEQSQPGSALSSASCRRSGRSPALPYPPHEWQDLSCPSVNPWQRGHLYFAKRGHFYFALTPGIGRIHRCLPDSP